MKQTLFTLLSNSGACRTSNTGTFTTSKARKQTNKPSFSKLLFLLLAFVLYGGIAFSQTTYEWYLSAPDGNWKQGAGGIRWQPGDLWDNPTSGTSAILRFNNNTQLSMTNNVGGTYVIHKLIFGSSNTSARTIGGNAVQFYEYSSTWPRIQNDAASVTHTINFSFSASTNSGYNMELFANTGSLVFGGAITNNGRSVLIYGNSSTIDGTNRFVRLTGEVSGAGKLVVSLKGVAKLNGTHTYTGNTEIDNGELWIETTGDAIASGSAIYLGNGGQLENVAKLFLSKSDGGTTFTRSITINNGNASTRFLGGMNTSGTNIFSAAIALTSSKPLNLEAVSAGGTTEFSGAISGTDGTVTTLGAGTIRFSTANTYTGATTVTAGTLEVAANLSSSLVTVQNLATLKITGDVSINALTINSGATVIVQAGKTLTVTGILTNATASGLVIESGGSLINNSASVAATVKREITKDNKWHFLSSPVSDQEICNSDFAPVTGSFNATTGVTFDFFRWSEPTVAGNKNWLNLKQTDWLPNTTAFGNPPKFAVKTGYLVAYSGTFAGSATKVFTGTLNTGDQSVTLTIGGNNWNLIGNPFPSAIDWDLVTGKSNLTSAYYYIYNALKSGGAGYEVLSTGYIPAMQGFFVKASTAGSLGFPFTSRVPGGTWLKSTETEPVNQLSLKLGKDAFYDVTSIIFSLNGSMNKAWYDADKLFSMDTKIPQVYSIKDNNQKICINTLPVIKDPVTVPLGIYIPADGNYTLELSGFESFSNLPGIVLEDLKTNTTRNLAQTPSYTFGALKTDDPARFLLHFAAAIGINEQPENNAFRFYTSENSLFVAGKTGKNQGNVYVYNMMGQLMQQQKLSGETLSVLRLNVPTGYYLVKVITDSQVSSGKVFVN